MASFVRVAEIASKGYIEFKGQLIRVVGDTAYEWGVESGEAKLAGRDTAIGHRVTDICESAQAWNLVRHHADTFPTMRESFSARTI